MCQLDGGSIRIPHTNHLLERFRQIRSELNQLGSADDVVGLVNRWLPVELENVDEFRQLATEHASGATNAEELLSSLLETIATPEIPPDVTEVRIMSLHKSKGLSSPLLSLPAV